MTSYDKAIRDNNKAMLKTVNSLIEEMQLEGCNEEAFENAKLLRENIINSLEQDCPPDNIDYSIELFKRITNALQEEQKNALQKEQE
jgi:hypothetical protein